MSKAVSVFFRHYGWQKLIYIFFILMFVLTGCKNEYSSLINKFKKPPLSNRIRVFWWWLEGNITKKGITRDLEEMKDKGIGGALLYDGGSSSYSVVNRTPPGPTFLSPEWRELYRFALKEAQRLGLEITLNAGGSGWNIGGPWVKPKYAAQKIVCSELSISGPVTFSDSLPFPNDVLRDSLGDVIYYSDLAVLAYRRNQNVTANRPPIRDWAIKTVYKLAAEGTDWASLLKTEPVCPGEQDVNSDSVLNVSAFMDRSGILTKKFPTGQWTVLRFGQTLTGRKQSTTSPGSEGWMIDPLNPKALETHFKNVLDTLVNDAGPLVGKTLKYLFVDSWEMRAVNWTTNFREEFKNRRGYDLLSFLPVFAGKIVDNREITNRFLYDFRRTIADCIADYHYGLFQQLSHSYGLLCNPEAGGPHPAPIDALQCLGCTDVPMGEFWARANTHRVQDWRRIFVKQAASAAHIHGKKLVAMEAFTSLGPHWEKDPYDLKPTADRAFCEGANQLFKVIFTHSPLDVGKPGYEFFAGTHFNPNITWWQQARAWTEYLNRCQVMLRQGLFVGDVCYYYGDNVPNFVPLKKIDPSLGPGYDYDVINSNVILTRMSVQNGKIALPNGQSYRLLVLPKQDAIPIDVLRKIATLVRDGATIVGPKPTKSLGLTNYPECDHRIKQLAEELWGACDGNKITLNRVGKGRVFWGVSLQSILKMDGIPPDFTYSGSPDTQLDYIHRQMGDTEIYFVTNRAEQYEELECRFRIRDKVPQIWYPDTGEIRTQPLYTLENDGIHIPLRLDPFGSLFVVFRPGCNKSKIDSFTRNDENVIGNVLYKNNLFPTAELIQKDENVELRAWNPGKYTLKTKNRTSSLNVYDVPEPINITGGFLVQFDENWGAPESILFDSLYSWTRSSNMGIKYYAGSATYYKEFSLADSLLRNLCVTLDLGVVKNIARVKLNGEDLGILWKKPFRIEITQFIQTGQNKLQIEITNLWPNRLIGDTFLSEEERFTLTNVKKFTQESKLLESGLIGPVQLVFSVPINVTL